LSQEENRKTAKTGKELRSADLKKNKWKVDFRIRGGNRENREKNRGAQN
jgi:hypothetical protein